MTPAIALLDANVLYPAPLRDLILNFSADGLISPRWSARIHEEWIRNLMVNRDDLKVSSLRRTQKLMDQAFPEANVESFTSIEKKLNMPDPDDNHVLAAAIKSKSQYLITFNLKDFPPKIANSHGINVAHPDPFLFDIIRKNENIARQSFINQVENLKHPPLKPSYVLARLEENSLTKSVERLRKLL